MKHPDWNPEYLYELMTKLGAYALRRQDGLDSETKSDGSPVTDVDKELERRLFAALVGDHHNWIGEESVEADGAGDPKKALSGTTWVIDPVDGTAAYAAGLPNWGLTIALMQDGRLVEGALYVPSTSEFIITHGEEVYASPQMNSTRPRMPHYSERLDDDQRLQRFTAPQAGAPESGLVSLTQGITKRGSFLGDNAVQTISSCVYSLVNLIKGRYGGYICLLKLWDIAGALPILARLNHVVHTQSGAPLGLDVAEPFYDLDSNSRRCWGVREHLLIGKDEATVQHLSEHSRFP